MIQKKIPPQYTIKILKKRLLLFLMLLFLADFVFIALHSIEALTSLIENDLYSLYKDGGYSEIYQYIKWFWIIILISYLSITNKSIHYGSWVLIFTYILFDDAFEIHENLGRNITEYLTFLQPLGLRIQDIGELVISSFAGIILLFFIAFSYMHGNERFRKISRDMFVLLSVSAFMSIFFDIAHSSIHIGRITTGIFGVAEDGGEMFSASLMLYYIFFQSLTNQNDDTFSFIDNFLPNTLKKSLKIPDNQ
ncbi:MAG: hypothetical protein Q3M24_10355 [Candidatus Electrothrix aestuarii]|uniref:Uncharacterized protein n=1 Tax=Candidatus Electrothrix aestuarii TaxID=3062594 RepID=A0AAU8M1H9_9BACT|nr:hypothetical protein [Candidatus Electrothrix aestuarii]